MILTHPNYPKTAPNLGIMINIIQTSFLSHCLATFAAGYGFSVTLAIIAKVISLLGINLLVKAAIVYK